MKQYIEIQFWNPKTEDEKSLRINVDNLKTCRLSDITKTVRYKGQQFVSGEAVGQIHIQAENVDEYDFTNYQIDEINIYDNEKIIASYNVIQSPDVYRLTIENGQFELLYWHNHQMNKLHQ